MTGRMNAVTWAVLDVYAQTVEGQAVSGLAQKVSRAAPITRLRNTARLTATGLGALDGRGQLTPQGWTAARNAVARLDLGTAGGAG